MLERKGLEHCHGGGTVVHQTNWSLACRPLHNFELRSRRAASQGDDWKVVVHPTNSFAFILLSSDKPVVQIGAVGWGPGWSWFGISSDTKATGDQLRISAPMEIGGQKPTLSLDVKSEGHRNRCLRVHSERQQGCADSPDRRLGQRTSRQ